MAVRTLLVSTIRDTKNKIVAYNFINYDKGNVTRSTVPANQIGFFAVKVKIENAELGKSKVSGKIDLKGTNGVIDRYPSFIKTPTGLTQTSFPIVVVSKLKDGFILSDGSGNLAKMTDRDVVAYMKLQGVANGKLVTKDGKTILSAISGNYVEEDGTVSGAPEKKGTADTKGHSSEFYKMIEKAFGKSKAAIIKYIVESKGVGSTEIFSKFLEVAPKQGIAVAGLLVLSDDILKTHKTDTQLYKLMCTIVEKGGVDIVTTQAHRGVDFAAIWDAEKTIGYVGDPAKENKYDITEAYLKNCVDNFKASKR